MVHAANAARLLPVPANEPPYDDGEPRLAAAGRAAGQAPLPLVFEPTRGTEPRGQRPVPAERVAAVQTAPAAALTFARQSMPAASQNTLADDLADLRPWRRSSRAELCDPYPWATRLSRGIAEVLSGVRAARQLATWLTPDALAVLVGCTPGRPTKGRSVVSDGRAPRVLVRSVRTCEPSDGACEISVHLRIGPRSRAVAMRAEGRNGRWICTELLLG